jgi:hypothetical protein
MLITLAIWAVAAVIILSAGVDAVRRRFAGDAPALTRKHLIWIIVGETGIIGSFFLLPVVAWIRDLL